MLNIGCHLSCANGYLAMGRQALEIGANTFQFFTRNPRGGSVKPFDAVDAEALNSLMKEHGFAPILAHAPYTLNAASADARVRDLRIAPCARIWSAWRISPMRCSISIRAAMWGRGWKRA